ncbi:hypothetical protein [Methylobacterium planeticum]|uniref:Uncharacterized protein n=1 Tax=Methylobacterium planeticum TaxID=2615211 RepID=A0A6N6MIH7_9HYPH|nr:hypothetical protein [Methylobacterium planeticum]KAB1068595.1 hypothetical protein F6X51_26555 [Methylobacterium planeticum]
MPGEIAAMSDHSDLEKLRRLGLVRRTADGAEAVKVTAQYRGAPVSRDRQAWKAEMEAWQKGLDGKLAKHGAEIVPNSLSLSAQTVEAVVPTMQLDAITNELKGEDVRVDIVVPRQVLGD